MERLVVMMGAAVPAGHVRRAIYALTANALAMRTAMAKHAATMDAAVPAVHALRTKAVMRLVNASARAYQAATVRTVEPMAAAGRVEPVMPVKHAMQLGSVKHPMAAEISHMKGSARVQSSRGVMKKMTNFKRMTAANSVT